MFDGFQGAPDRESKRRFALSTGASLLLYGTIGAIVIAIASRPRDEEKKEPVVVAFHRPAAPKPKAAPPPLPEPEPKPEPKPRERQRIASAATAPPVPTTIPDAALTEGRESDFQRGALGDVGKTPVIGGLGGGGEMPPPPPPPPAEKRKRRAPVILPEDASPPQPSSSNRRPTYPEDARKRGEEGLVVLRVLIVESGVVGDIEVIEGSEPFLSAAISVVRSWSYEPAVVDGEKTAVYRIIRVPFRLKG